jgi:hypothetical protein
VSCRRSASFILVAGALSVACGARSGLECFGESCSRLDDGEGGQQGFEPDGDEDDDEPGVQPPFGTGGTAGTGGGGRPTRPPRPDQPPDDLPSSQPDDLPVASLCANGGSFDGSIQVGDETTLEQLRGCAEIDGDLTISGTGLGSLEPLFRLRIVTGALTVSNFVGALDGLRALEGVRSLTLENTSVATLSPLQNLFQIGSGRPLGGALVLSQNQLLTDLSGLGNIQAITSISISDNPLLLTLAGLNVPAEVETLSVHDNPQLSELAGLENLQVAQAVEIRNSPSLRSVAGLASLRSTTSLALVNVPNVTALELPQLGSVSVFYLENVGVATLNGLSALRQVDSAVIQNNPSLLDVERLGALEAIRELSVINNSSLARLPDFTGVISVDQVYVRNNPALVVGPGYPNVAEAGTILISDNPSLTNLTGFRILQRAREIDISRNPSLVELDLGTLGSARSVRITCNTTLPESSLEAVMLNVQGTVDVWGNQGSPRTCP